MRPPPPPVASSSRPRAAERQERNGKIPARVLDPPVGEVAALELGLDEAAEGEGPGRRLDGVPLEVQEAWICEDLIFVLQVSRAELKLANVS
jgi:gamma-tubulin complex component 2